MLKIRDLETVKKVEDYNQKNKDTKAIPLTRGQITIIDKDIYDIIKQYNWHASGAKKYYAKRQKTLLHHEVLRIIGIEIPKKHVVDHINGKTLDNRRINLRCVTQKQNSRNSKNIKNDRGVSIIKNKGKTKWQASITIDNETIYLGIYRKKKKAALAWDKAALQAGYDKWVLNYPNKIDEHNNVRINLPRKYKPTYKYKKKYGFLRIYTRFEIYQHKPTFSA